MIVLLPGLLFSFLTNISGTAYREKANETQFYMPGIPSHPVGYGIAVKLME